MLQEADRQDLMRISLLIMLSMTAFGCSHRPFEQVKLEIQPTNGWPRGEVTVVAFIENKGIAPIRLRGWFTNDLDDPPNIDIYTRALDAEYARALDGSEVPLYDTSALYNSEPAGHDLLLMPNQRVYTTTVLPLRQPPGRYEFFAALRKYPKIRSFPTAYEVFPGPDPPIKTK